LDSDLYRTVNGHSGVQAIGVRIFAKFMLHPQVNGAYTELFAGLSPDVTMEKSGCWSKFCAEYPCSGYVS
jgi:hypothetical protein